MNVPNHAQADRIAKDIRTLMNGGSVDYWQGNSYKGYTVTGNGVTNRTHYKLTHWNTVIAIVTFRSDGSIRVQMDASYYSVTKRGFQTRIARGLFKAGISTNVIDRELAMPVRERGDVYYQCDRSGLYIAHVGDNDELV